MHLHRRFLACAVALLFFVGSAAADTNPLVKTEKLSKEQVRQVWRMGLDIVEDDGGRLSLILWPGDAAKLDASGIGYETVHADITAFYQSRYPDKDIETMGGFRTWSETIAYLDSLSAAYPAICSPRFSIGQSWEGRDLWVVKISDNHAVDEDEPEVFYNSLIHAREGASLASILRYMEWLLQNYGVDPEVTEVIDNRELFFLPVFNPDGYVYNQTTNPTGGGMWRKNRRTSGQPTTPGVDLNRNWGYQWGYDDEGSSPNPSDATYRGPSAFSEPETQAVRDFSFARDFTIVHNVHTYSNLVLWPWGYDYIYTDEEDFFRILGDSMVQYNGYSPGISWTLYPTNGASDDWYWGDTLSKPRTISLTTEIGSSTDGFWPSLSRIPVLAEENILPHFFLAKIADRPYALKPPAAPVASVPDSSGGAFTVSWNHSDTVNPAVSFRLIELGDRQSVTDDAEADYGYWQVDTWGLSTTRAFSGLRSWATASVSQTDHTLTSVDPYEVKPNDSLRFRIWYDIESNWDYLYVQVSINGGQTFESLANDLTTNTNPNGTNRGNGITGSSGGSWLLTKFDLSAYAGQQVFVRLLYATDAAVLNEGVWVDDVENVEFFGVQTELESATAQTSYTFTSHDAGDWWYRVSATDAEGQESVFSSLVKTSVSQSWTLADLNGDEQIDLSDLIYFVNYLFLGGPAPSVSEAADVTCDSLVDLSDLIFLVNFLFTGGPAPSCP